MNVILVAYRYAKHTFKFSLFPEISAQIARLKKDMLAKGWLQKQSSEKDKRSQILTLSNSGKKLQQQISRLENQLASRIETGLTEQDVKDFRRISEKMLANLASHTWQELNCL